MAPEHICWLPSLLCSVALCRLRRAPSAHLAWPSTTAACTLSRSVCGLKGGECLVCPTPTSEPSARWLLYDVVLGFFLGGPSSAELSNSFVHSPTPRSALRRRIAGGGKRREWSIRYGRSNQASDKSKLGTASTGVCKAHTPSHLKGPEHSTSGGRDSTLTRSDCFVVVLAVEVVAILGGLLALRTRSGIRCCVFISE